MEVVFPILMVHVSDSLPPRQHAGPCMCMHLILTRRSNGEQIVTNHTPLEGSFSLSVFVCLSVWQMQERCWGPSSHLEISLSVYLGMPVPAVQAAGQVAVAGAVCMCVSLSK